MLENKKSTQSKYCAKIFLALSGLYSLLILTITGANFYSRAEEQNAVAPPPADSPTAYREYMTFYSVHDAPANTVQQVEGPDSFLNAPNCNVKISVPEGAFPLRFQIRNGCIAEIVLRYKDYFYQYNATKDPYQNITGLRFYAYSALARSYDLIKLDFVCPDWQLRFNSKSGRSIPGQFRRYDVYAREVAWKSDGVRYSLMIHRSMHPLGTVLKKKKKYKSIDNYTDLFNLAQKAVQQDVR